MSVSSCYCVHTTRGSSHGRLEECVTSKHGRKEARQKKRTKKETMKRTKKDMMKESKQRTQEDGTDGKMSILSGCKSDRHRKQDARGEEIEQK